MTQSRDIKRIDVRESPASTAATTIGSVECLVGPHGLIERYQAS
jgi:hypothetical protein